MNRYSYIYLVLAGLVACDGENPAPAEQTDGAPEAEAPAVALEAPATAPPTADPLAADPLAVDPLAVDTSGSANDTAAREEMSDATTDVPAAPTSTPSSGRDSPATSEPAEAPAVEDPAQTPPATRADDILERAERVYAEMRSMEADFQQQVYVPLLDDTQHGHGKIYHRTPSGFRLEFVEPEGDVIVADGQYLWMYYPSTDPRQVMRSRLAEGEQRVDLHREFLSDATDRYDATLTGAETVGGRETHTLTLEPRDAASPYRTIRLWIDGENALVRRFEIIEENGSVRTLELSNIQPNVALDDDLFQFTPPPGAVVYDAA